MENFFATFNDILVAIDDFVWGVPLMALILCGGLVLTIRSGGVQFRNLFRALRYMWKNEKGAAGELSSFAALCTALSATVGTGNIVGVATAIATGGPGAVFWMIVAAVVGMATKYAEGLLAVKYRTVDKFGHVLGGPFYYIERGMGKKWKWLAVLFAIFGCLVGLLGIGTFTQVNSITGAIQTFFDPNFDPAGTAGLVVAGRAISWSVVIGGALLAVLVCSVLIGGIKRIAAVASRVVPAMIVVYLGCAILILVLNITKVPEALGTIIYAAFNPAAVTGGIVGSIIVAMQKGVARGIFSNEAGLGSAPIAAAAAQTREPVRQGLVSMTGTFIDTIVVCLMTALCIVVTGAWSPDLGLQGVQITNYAFQQGLPFPAEISSFLLMACMVVFGFTTILGWDYYSERCLEYLIGSRKKKGILAFRWVYILCVFAGPYFTVAAVWTIADIVNGLMALPNMIALIALSGVVAKETKDYLKRLKAAGDNEEEMEEYSDDYSLWKSKPDFIQD